MATYAATRLFQTQPGVAYATAYTVPALTSAIIKELVVCNTTAVAVTFDASFVASGGTAGVANAVIYQASINPYQTVIYSFSQVLAAAGFVSLRAGTATALTVTGSGVQIT